MYEGKRKKKCTIIVHSKSSHSFNKTDIASVPIDKYWNELAVITKLILYVYTKQSKFQLNLWNRKWIESHFYFDQSQCGISSQSQCIVQLQLNQSLPLIDYPIRAKL